MTRIVISPHKGAKKIRIPLGLIAFYEENSQDSGSMIHLTNGNKFTVTESPYRINKIIDQTRTRKVGGKRARYIKEMI